MNGYTKLFSTILDSTLWTQEGKETKLVWIAMLAMKNRSQIVLASIPGLAKRAGVSLEECEFALERLKQPDKYSRTKEKEGRRIEDVDGGWFIINGEKYRNAMSVEERRDYNRVKQQEYRKKNPGWSKKSKPLKGELEYVKATVNGAPPEVLDDMAARDLPREGEETK